MPRFDLFDSVKLRNGIRISEARTAPAGTPGAVVEVLNGGQAYLVELFGDWVTGTDHRKASPGDSEAFRESLGVVTAAPEQLELVEPASQTVGLQAHLMAIVEELPREMQEQVADFADFLRQKRRRDGQKEAV